LVELEVECLAVLSALLPGLLLAALVLLARLLLAAALMLLVRLVLAAALLLARLLVAALLLLARLVRLTGILIGIVGICHTGLLEGSKAPRPMSQRKETKRVRWHTDELGAILPRFRHEIYRIRALPRLARKSDLKARAGVSRKSGSPIVMAKIGNLEIDYGHDSRASKD
jgi:hypothetical protein